MKEATALVREDRERIFGLIENQMYPKEVRGGNARKT